MTLRVPAREQAIEAIIDAAYWNSTVRNWDRVARILDALPDDLLVDLLVERGVLEPVTLPHGNHSTRTYQRKDT